MAGILKYCLSMVIFIQDPLSSNKIGDEFLYSDATLQYWAPRYEKSTTRIYNEVIRPVLTQKDKEFIDKHMDLRFPLYPLDEMKRHPLAYYRLGKRIEMPIHSLKFLDDLCTAYAWLQINGFGLETISEYTAILKYGNIKAPPPLEALGIPPNALNNPEVDALALGHFVTARTFILLHEMGHLLYNHHSDTPQESIRNEQQADQFAISTMNLTGLTPLGMIVFFMADAHWSSYPPEPGTHPLSGSRLKELARNIRDPQMVGKIDSLSRLLDDPEIRAGFVLTGKAGNLDALRPRLPKELPKNTGYSGNSGIFDGTYRGEFIQFNDPKPLQAEYGFKRNGNSVSGYFSFGLGKGTFNGRITGNELHFFWEYGNNYGKGILKEESEGTFSGFWGYREAKNDAGKWSGKRIP
jgi:hypothetical protein